jgi:hypothetical protein
MKQVPSIRGPIEVVKQDADAARAAAGAAAGDAAWAAAGDAAWDAAKKNLAPTVKKLQKSALALVEKMIEVVA